jgi:hypothetical protein
MNQNTAKEFIKEYLESKKSTDSFTKFANILEEAISRLRFDVSSIIFELYTAIQKMVPNEHQKQLISDVFMLQFYSYKLTNNYFSYYHLLEKNSTKEIADYLYENGCYRKVVMCLLDFFLIIADMQMKEQERKKTIEHNYKKVQYNTNSFDNSQLHWEDDLTYWEDVYDGDQLPPWEIRSNTFDSGHNYFEDFNNNDGIKSEFDYFLKQLNNSKLLYKYIDLIETASDLDTTEKLIYLKTIDNITNKLPIAFWPATHSKNNIETKIRLEKYIYQLQPVINKYDLIVNIEKEAIYFLRGDNNKRIVGVSITHPIEEENQLQTIELYDNLKNKNQVTLNPIAIKVAKEILQTLGGYDLPERVWKDLKFYIEEKEEQELYYDNGIKVTFHHNFKSPMFKAEIRFTRQNKYKKGYIPHNPNTKEVQINEIRLMICSKCKQTNRVTMSREGFPICGSCKEPL